MQRKGEGCRECEDQFRREVLIDRLVADSLSTRSSHAVRANKGLYVKHSDQTAKTKCYLDRTPGFKIAILHETYLGSIIIPLGIQFEIFKNLRTILILIL